MPVSPLEPPSWKTEAAVIGGTIASLVLTGALLFMVWRLRRDRSTIQQLSSMTYTNGIVRPAAGGVVADQDQVNRTLDPSKLSDNLID